MRRDLFKLGKKKTEVNTQNIKSSTSQANPYMDDNVAHLSF